LDLWEVTKALGSETASIVGNKIRLDIANGTQGQIDVVYQYLIPSGDFDIRIDFDDYAPDGNNPGFYIYWFLSDVDATDDAISLRYNIKTNGTVHEIRSRMRDNGVNDDATVNPANRPTAYKVVRSGTEISTYYYLSGWQLMDTHDFGARAGNIEYVRMKAGYALGDTGGYADLDNLLFISGCPDGYPKAWTTTSSTTSTTTSTTTCTTTSTPPP
jgi:DUF971 family protein